MTREEAIKSLQFVRNALDNSMDIAKAYEMAIEALKQEPCEDVISRQFAEWVAREIFDDMWECNKDAFAELACRKLAKLGIVRANGDKWELIEPQESEEA